jgi:hypothetical protein
VSLLVGLKLRSQNRAIIGSTGALVAWCVIPVFFVTIPMEIWLGHTGIVSQSTVNCSSLLSPAMGIAYNELDWLHELGSEPWRAMFVSFTGYASLLVIFRRLCLVRADRWLGRLQESGWGNARNATQGDEVILRQGLFTGQPMALGQTTKTNLTADNTDTCG